MLNMTAFHREHETFYGVWPWEQAVVLQRYARALHALADRWTTATPTAFPTISPYGGAEDLNDPAAIQLCVLFMEGENEPVELRRLKRDLGAMAAMPLGRVTGSQSDGCRMGHGADALRHRWPRRSAR
jgi:hypothetical protein